MFTILLKVIDIGSAQYLMGMRHHFGKLSHRLLQYLPFRPPIYAIWGEFGQISAVPYEWKGPSGFLASFAIKISSR